MYILNERKSQTLLFVILSLEVQKKLITKNIEKYYSIKYIGVYSYIYICTSHIYIYITKMKTKLICRNKKIIIKTYELYPCAFMAAWSFYNAYSKVQFL